jgi:PAS domain S-box-containing protein
MMRSVSDLNDDELEPLHLAAGARSDELSPPSSALRDMVARLVLDTTNEGIWLIDAQARTTFVNNATAQLLGYTEDEMIGMHIFEFMAEQRRPIAQKNLVQRQQGVEDRQEVELRRKDGTFVWVIASANPVYDREGRYAGALALLGDLTKQKHGEERLRAELEDLKARVQKNTSPSSMPAAPASLGRELVRAATVVAAGGIFVSFVGVLTAAGVFSSLLFWSRKQPMVAPLEY